MTEIEKFKLKDILYGLVLPVLVAIVILLFPTVIKNALDATFPPANMMTGDAGSPYAFITIIFTQGLALMVMFAIPLLIGLLWNKWAGGATGFLTGTLYYLANAGYNIQYSVINFGSSSNLYADPAFIGDYIVCGILVGYITGALNNRSYNFKRMLGAGITAAITVGVMQFTLNMTVSSAAWMARADPFTAFYQIMLPMVILGVIAPIIAKVFTWYGISPSGSHS